VVEVLGGVVEVGAPASLPASVEIRGEETERQPAIGPAISGSDRRRHELRWPGRVADAIVRP
jgi:hypothetical protein